jgi:hypothetical protein
MFFMTEVIWVDEDIHLLEGERDGIKCFGYKVSCINNANSAFKYIKEKEDILEVRLIILDVMLLSGIGVNDGKNDHIAPSSTAGLELARKLCQHNPALGGKIVFFTCISDEGHINNTQTCAQEIGADFLPKSTDLGDIRFALKLREMGKI